MVRKLSIDVTPGFCIFWAVMLLLLPLRWIFAAAMAAFIHECSHYIMLKLLNVSVYGITIGVSGAVIETEPMGPHQEFCCALAGPLGSFLLMTTARWCPILALCGFVQGLYNLIPVMNFDGGRVVNAILQICFPDTCCSIMKWIQSAFCGLIVIAGIFCLQFGILPLLISLLLLLKVVPRKRPCKEGLKRVQCS